MGTTNAWATTTNWSPSGLPGATSGDQSSGEAVFTSATSNQTVSLTSPNFNLGTIDFGLNAYNGSTGYTINASSGGSLLLSNVGNVAIFIDPDFTGTNITQTVNAPISLIGNYSFANWTFGSSNNNLVIGGAGNLITGNPNVQVQATAPTASATYASGTTSIVLSSTTGLAAGEVISGNGIPAGDTISSISGTTVVLKTALNGTLTSGNTVITTSGVASQYTTAAASTTSSTTLTVASASGMTVGEVVGGTGIPTGDYITAINGSTITLASAATVASGTIIDGFSTSTLNLNGVGNGTVSGNIVDGAGGALSLVEEATGANTTWTLSGNNTYTGTTVLEGGTLLLDFTTATGTGAQRISTNALTMGTPLGLSGEGGSTLVIKGNSTYAETQNVASLTMNAGAGANAIVIDANGQATSLNVVGALTRSTGSTLDVTLNNSNAKLTIGSAGFLTSGGNSTSNGVTAETTTATGVTNSSTITVTSAAGLAVGQVLSGPAGIPAGDTITAISGTTITLASKTTAAVSGSVTATTGIDIGITSNGMTDWATYANGQIEDYVTAGGSFNGGGSSTAFGAGVQTDLTGSYSNVGNQTTNSLRFNQAAGDTLGMGGGKTLSIASGQIMVTSNVGANNTAITGGSLEAAASGAGELIVYQNNTLGTFTISSTLSSADVTALTKTGAGTLIINDSTNNTYTGKTSIEEGTIQIATGLSASGVTTPLGTGIVSLTGPASTLDLNGNSISVGSIESSNAFNTDVVEAASGYDPQITNTAAGTQSILTITNGSSNASNSTSQNTISLTQGAGAALGLTITGGNILLGQYSMNTLQSNVATGGGVATSATPTNLNYDLIYGPLTLQGSSTLSAGIGGNGGLLANFVTTSALDFASAYSYYGSVSTSAGDAYGELVGTTYLEGSGGYLNVAVHTGGIVVADTGSAADNATGFNDYGGTVDVAGTGPVSIAAFNLSGDGFNNIGSFIGQGTGTITFGGLSGSSSYGIEVDGLATINVTGTGATASTTGLVLGSGTADSIGIAGGTLNVAPSGSGTTLVLKGDTGTGAITYGAGGGTLELSRGGYTGITLDLGTGPAQATTVINRLNQGTLILMPASGLANLGNPSGLAGAAGETLQVLSTSAKTPALTAGIVAPWMIGENTAANGGNGDFLTYIGTGTTTDNGFEEVTASNDSANYLTSFSGSTNAKVVELIGAGTTNVGANTSAYALRDDGTVNIASTFTLTLGVSSGQAGLILNGGSINGAGTLATGSAELLAFTSAANGTIATNITGTGGLTKFGPGTLYLTYGSGEGYTGITTIDSGALDISGTSLSTSSAIDLNGGVLQGSGSFTRNLYTGGLTPTSANTGAGSNSVVWGGNFYATPISALLDTSGGFSASTGEFDIAIGGTSSPTQLTWNTAGFVGEGGVLMFGSTTSAGLLKFENPLSLGTIIDSGFYDRIINVTANSADNLNGQLPTALGGVGTGTFEGDYTNMTGAITASGPQFGLVESGNGILQLSGTNTYAGSTSITGGILLVSSDTNLGTAPTKAYPLIAVPNANNTGYLNGHTLTPGAIQIDGGTLAANATFALNANRTVLLGPVANIDVTGTNTLTFNGLISDYVNETGALNKVDAGNLVLGGDNSYSGSTTISDGTLSVNALLAAGTAQPLGLSDTLTLSGSSSSAQGVFQYTGGGAGTTNTLAQNVNVTAGDYGTISNTSGDTLTVTGTLTKANSVLTFSGGVFDVTGQITGGTSADFNSDLVVNDGATVILDNNTDNYTGPTSVYGGGTLQDGVGTAPSGTVLTLGNATDGAVTNTFDLNGNNQTLGALDSTSNSGRTNINKVINSSSSATPLTLTLTGLNSDNAAVSSNFGGVIQDGASARTALAITGGTHTFSGANTYSGGTTISGGGTFVVGGTNTLLTTGTVTLGESTANTSGTMQLGTSSSAYNQTLATLNTAGTGSSNAVVGGNVSTSTLTLNNSSSDTFGGTLGGATGYQNDLALTKSGAGTLILSGNNSYSGGTTVNSGTLQLSNSSGSATGSGALSVGAGAVLAGTGASSGTGFSITGSSAVATVLVGHNNAGDINTTGVMSLSGSGASSIGAANLVFNLNSNVAGQGNELNVGKTAITFNTVGSLNTTMALNIEGTGFIAGYTGYVLVAGTGTTIMGDSTTPTATSGQYGGLETFVNSRGQNQIVTGPTSNLTLTFADPTQASFYAAHSYLFLVDNGGVDDIEVEVVPEPGTWAMMLGGLAMLIVWQRRKNKQA